jgi:hypothetical protein
MIVNEPEVVAELSALYLRYGESVNKQNGRQSIRPRA